MDGGECRAAWTRHVVQGLDTLPAPTRERVRTTIRPGTLERIESSLAVGWLPLELHVEVLETTRGVLGEVPYREFWRGRTAASLEMPLLFGKVARVVIRRFSGDALSFIKTIPMSFRYVVRDAGKMSAEVTPRFARLILDDFPREHAGGGWADGWVGALQALSHRLMEREVLVTLEERQPTRGRFVWRIDV